LDDGDVPVDAVDGHVFEEIEHVAASGALGFPVFEDADGGVEVGEFLGSGFGVDGTGTGGGDGGIGAGPIGAVLGGEVAGVMVETVDLVEVLAVDLGRERATGDGVGFGRRVVGGLFGISGTRRWGARGSLVRGGTRRFAGSGRGGLFGRGAEGGVVDDEETVKEGVGAAGAAEFEVGVLAEFGEEAEGGAADGFAMEEFAEVEEAGGFEGGEFGIGDAEFADAGEGDAGSGGGFGVLTVAVEVEEVGLGPFGPGGA
jgi:hypothetical protein